MTLVFEEVSVLLKRIAALNLCLSGTTAVTALLHANHLVVANLGDSRWVPKGCTVPRSSNHCILVQNRHRQSCRLGCADGSGIMIIQSATSGSTSSVCTKSG